MGKNCGYIDFWIVILWCSVIAVQGKVKSRVSSLRPKTTQLEQFWSQLTAFKRHRGQWFHSYCFRGHRQIGKHPSNLGVRLELNSSTGVIEYLVMPSSKVESCPGLAPERSASGQL
jgi:hypothetical protein